MNRRAMKIGSTLGLPALSLLLCACNPAGAPSATEQPPLAGAKIGGAFTLSDKAGKTVRWQDFDGKYRIVYFGYAFCPDACPMDVGVMMKGFAAFETAHPALAAQVQPIFITIDPARDTPQVVGEFAAAFSPRLLGLTGTPEQVDTAAKAFRAYYAKGQEAGGGYLMDHSRIAYLMGRKGEPISMLPVDKGPEAVTADLVKWVK
ncbi:MAG: SCO family protein [Novosphingobium sp.]|nr:SCO family protein [Novosphingobium sp.]